MSFVTANGIEMCVEEHGPASARPLLLIAGFSAQLVSWDPGFLDSLVDRGFRVITFGQPVHICCPIWLKMRLGYSARSISNQRMSWERQWVG